MKHYCYVGLLAVLKELLSDLPFIYHETSVKKEREVLVRTFNRAQSINQRIENLIRCHRRVMIMRIDPVFKYSFIRLQRCQFEFLSDEIKNILSGVMNLTDSSVHRDSEKLSMYFDLVNELLFEIREELRADIGPIFPNLPPLTKLQISICRQLYSHPMEFIILQRFLKVKRENIMENDTTVAAGANINLSPSPSIFSSEVQQLTSIKLYDN
jgi:hypothetical protein